MSIEISIGTIEDVVLIDAQIPEFTTKTTAEAMRQRLDGKPHLLLIAKQNGMPVGYKLGYALSDSEFYSWHGAVVPDFRKMGIATQLREYQERWAQQQGYGRITVRSMNKFPGMLQLLISSGYQIAGYIDEGSPSKSKILFAKELTRA